MGKSKKESLSKNQWIQNHIEDSIHQIIDIDQWHLFSFLAKLPIDC